jgi:hypothetical protein
MKDMMNRRLFVRITVGLVPVAAAVVLFADSNMLTVKIRDDCDPKTFNLALGPGACVGKGETTFTQFNAEFAKEGQVDDWAYSTDHATVDIGATVKLQSRGGETHTFTRVAEFGGGFIPPLNVTPKGTVLAARPECAQAPGVPQPPSLVNNFVPAGMTITGPTAGVDFPAGKTTKFQCCIHPWMRTEIEVK